MSRAKAETRLPSLFFFGCRKLLFAVVERLGDEMGETRRVVGESRSGSEELFAVGLRWPSAGLVSEVLSLTEPPASRSTPPKRRVHIAASAISGLPAGGLPAVCVPSVHVLAWPLRRCFRAEGEEPNAWRLSSINDWATAVVATAPPAPWRAKRWAEGSRSTARIRCKKPLPSSPREDGEEDAAA